MLGTSFPPVLSIACRIAKAKALNADSALRERGHQYTRIGMMVDLVLHVVVVLASDPVDVQGDAGGERERLKQVGDHLG